MPKLIDDRNSTATGPIFQLKITLNRTRPPIWRRVLAPKNIKLPKLHRLIQSAFGWYDCHLHCFRAFGERYEAASPDYPLDGANNEAGVPLDRLAPGPGCKVEYEYDFGDSWCHTILVEKALAIDENQLYPVCVGGKRAGPPEDCGGVWGYASLLETLANPDHEDHDEMSDWVGGTLDPEEFRESDVNARFTSRKPASINDFPINAPKPFKAKPRAEPNYSHPTMSTMARKEIKIVFTGEEVDLEYVEITEKLNSLGPTKAIERALRSYLERHPDFTPARESLAYVLEYQGLHSEALEIRGY